MRTLFLSFLCFSICHSKLNAQLRYLYSEDFKSVEKVGDVFEKFNFAVSYKNGVRNLKSADGKKYYFKPDRSVYYEVFQTDFLLISTLDSSIIKKGLSIAPFLFSRNRVYIFPIKNIGMNEIYYVDFDGRKIIEEASKLKADTGYYQLDQIDIKRMKVYLYNPANKQKEEFSIYKELKSDE